ncbi:MAG: GHMP kinase [Candidatus Sumerlaeaceae bacterium]|nr:GHMP kinase [Candidatus Sumerlaeaceae bacterium]
MVSRRIHSRAPIRVDFAGGWTDVPPFSEREGGAVVNATINRYTYATLVPRDDQRIGIISADFEKYVEVADFRSLEYDGNLDLIKAAVKILDVELGMDLFVRCDAPPGSGTGSSSSISVALIGLLNSVQKQKLSPHEVAKLARTLEVRELKIAGGKQDHYASALGGINFLEFEDPAVSSSHLHLAPATLRTLEKQLLLCYTGQSRLSGDIIKTVMGAYERNEAATVAALRRLKGIAFEVKDALISGDLRAFAGLLAENWECQKALDASTTNPQIDRLFQTANRAGALGGKACGAGGGGCVLFYCDDNKEHLVRKALMAEGAQIIEFNLETDGLQTWENAGG